MSDILQSLKITTPYKAVIVVSAAAFLIALGAQRDALTLIFGGTFLIGVGEWRNHPRKQVDFRPASAGTWAKVTDVPRKANFVGISLQVIGAALVISGTCHAFGLTKF